MNVASVAFAIFGERLKKKGGHDSLQRTLKQAHMAVSYEMYMSSVYLYSLIAGIVGTIVGAILAYAFTHNREMSEPITKFTYHESSATILPWLLQYKEQFITLFIMLLCVAGIGGVTFLLLRSVPAMKVSGRKSEINKILPYAVTFMYALSRGGMNIIEVFKSLAESEDTYGEVSKEAASIINDMEFFGADLRTAIQHSVEMSPSEKFQQLMHSLLTVIDSGGDMVAFFADKSDEYLDAAVMDQKGFLATLELIAESYVTAFVAGPLFIIIIQTVMSVMGSAEHAALYAIIYAMIPIGSVMFVVMIYLMTPTEMGKFAPLDIETEFDTEITIPDEGDEIEQFSQLDKDKKGLTFKHNLKHPLDPIRENPLKVLIVTGPISIGLLIFAIARNIGLVGFGDVLLNYLILIAYILVVPLTYFYETKSRKEKKVRRDIPDFLHKLAITNEIGMTLPQSIELMSKSDSGSITPEVKKIWNDIDWGLGVNDAFRRFANRLKMGSVGRTVTLLTEAFKSSGDVKDVLEITSKDARTTQILERERSTNMLIYVVIIYMSFLVFTIVIFILCSSFLPVMADAGGNLEGSGGGAAGGATFMKGFDLEFYNNIFFHAALIQGFCSGLVAGQMGEGKVLGGLKHSLIMLTIAYVIFTFFV
ncbi:MAG: type II secretion system F family protein [Halobacteriota archaeon]|nr:type II secretion system F family protein [Halobacteriota archaeon]